mmetsp:Transcript_42413/g.122671  ORF Transcript_42413/g.122671 Transcript_42413/m.122671 type:complete len:242 (-) Transcript_42413:156-881(-)
MTIAARHEAVRKGGAPRSTAFLELLRRRPRSHIPCRGTAGLAVCGMAGADRRCASQREKVHEDAFVRIGFAPTGALLERCCGRAGSRNAHVLLIHDEILSGHAFRGWPRAATGTAHRRAGTNAAATEAAMRCLPWRRRRQQRARGGHTAHREGASARTAAANGGAPSRGCLVTTQYRYWVHIQASLGLSASLHKRGISRAPRVSIGMGVGLAGRLPHAVGPRHGWRQPSAWGKRRSPIRQV